MPATTPNQAPLDEQAQRRIRQLLDEGDRQEARQQAIEDQYRRYRPWLHLTVVLRHLWDFAERQRLVGAWLPRVLRMRPTPSSLQPSSGPSVTPEDRAARALKALRKKSQEDRE